MSGKVGIITGFAIVVAIITLCTIVEALTGNDVRITAFGSAIIFMLAARGPQHVVAGAVSPALGAARRRPTHTDTQE